MAGHEARMRMRERGEKGAVMLSDNIGELFVSRVWSCGRGRPPTDGTAATIYRGIRFARGHASTYESAFVVRVPRALSHSHFSTGTRNSEAAAWRGKGRVRRDLKGKGCHKGPDTWPRTSFESTRPAASLRPFRASRV
jgi:hypothetical protein